MKNEKGHIKILSTLSLAASDTREDTLTSVILNTLYENGELSKEEVCQEVEKLYEFAPYKDEIYEILNKLGLNKSIEYEEGKYSLSFEQKTKLDELEIQLRDRDKARYQNFKNFVSEEIGSNLESSAIQLLWQVFVEFLYSNFYEYGQEALKRFHPHLDGENELVKEEDFLQAAFEKLKDKQLSSVFRVVVEKFPDYASKDDLDFLNELAQKTLSFASLGVDPKIAEVTLEKSLVDWVLYLDTNVLYSLLGLHSHPENESAEALIQLIRDNKQHIDITFRYSELTKKELSAKRDDFKLLDDKLTDPAIKALLRSDELDNFSKQFYEHLLRDRKSTLHPSEIIDLSTDLLKRKDVDIARNQKRVEQIGEDYLNTRIQDYRRFIDFKNEVKQQFCDERKIPFRPIYRSDKQITHDITLREIILHQRASFTRKNQTTPSLNSIKYFAVTLDQVLMDYDKQQLKDHQDEKSFPIFFKPSFLMNKLIRVLPIKTPNYKKAFLKAVSSRGFNKDVRKSRDILKIVNFLKSQGIDNEDVVYNLITEEIFLEKFKNAQNETDFNQGEFIQSELNRELNVREKELVKTKEELYSKSEEAENQTKLSRNLESKKSSLEEELGHYRNALNKLNKDVKKLQSRPVELNSQSSINFEAEEQKKEKEKYKRQLKNHINSEIALSNRKVFSRWQWNVMWNLLWVLPITIGSIVFILHPEIIPSTTMDASAIRTILGLVTLLVDGLFLYLVKMRFWDEGNMDKKLAKIPIPEKLQTKLEELEK